MQRVNEGVFGNREKRAFISGEQRLNFEGNKDNIGEQGTYENTFSIFGEQMNKPIYFRGTGEQRPSFAGNKDNIGEQGI